MSDDTPAALSPNRILLPIMAAVLCGFLIIGVALPVLPLHVQHGLGFSTFVVGLVAGSQFVASLVSRPWAGSLSDRHGAKRVVMLGLVTACAAGALYLASLAVTTQPVLSVEILLLGRGVMGAAESFIITGAVSWGLGLLDAQHSGKVIAWIGTAMFVALAAGGPLGTMLYDTAGFALIAAVTVLLPLAVLVLVLRQPSGPTSAHSARPSHRTVAAAVWLPGCAAALSSIGYGAIQAFGSLLFANNNWQPVWLAFTAFGFALIGARLWLGHLPDRKGGARIAMLFALVQAGGLATIALAGSSVQACLGAAITGFGYSLVYPGLGVEAVRRVDPANRGLAMGLYTAFLDVALGLGTPALGVVADRNGLASAFAASACAALIAGTIAWALARSNRA